MSSSPRIAGRPFRQLLPHGVIGPGGLGDAQAPKASVSMSIGRSMSGGPVATLIANAFRNRGARHPSVPTNPQRPSAISYSKTRKTRSRMGFLAKPVIETVDL